MTTLVEEKILFELGAQPETVEPPAGLPSDARRTTALPLGDIPEPQVIRHFFRLSNRNMAIDQALYPLGSCTMKYNPRLNEKTARYAGFAHAHPLQPEDEVQGALELIYTLEHWISEIIGMPHISLHPAAGAHGELTGMWMMKRWHEDKQTGKNVVLVPESAHGTNPASAVMAGFEVRNIPDQGTGYLKWEHLEPYLTDDVAAIMMTNPNTLGVFEKDIQKVADWMHANDALLYWDGANMNAIMGRAKPGHLGADVIQLNLHKTFSTPHGGGGPGCGPIGISERLQEYAPVPRVAKDGERFVFEYEDTHTKSIGPVKAFYGHFGMAVRALTYMLRLGGQGLEDATSRAVLNANYLGRKLEAVLARATDEPMLHEAVFSDKTFDSIEATTMDFAKALLDHGFHPPTVYFPLIVHGAMMIEPTETEEPEELDRFAQVFFDLVEQAQKGDDFHDQPQKAFRRRLDEVTAARKPVLRWTAPEAESE
jgi:glycine dehydrogenase subunit 2